MTFPRLVIQRVSPTCQQRFFIFIFKFNFYLGVAVHYTVARPARKCRKLSSTQQSSVQREGWLQTEREREKKGKRGMGGPVSATLHPVGAYAGCVTNIPNSSGWYTKYRSAYAYTCGQINTQVPPLATAMCNLYSFDLTNTSSSNFLPWVAHHLSTSASASYPNRMSFFVLSAH